MFTQESSLSLRQNNKKKHTKKREYNSNTIWYWNSFAPFFCSCHWTREREKLCNISNISYDTQKLFEQCNSIALQFNWIPVQKIYKFVAMSVVCERQVCVQQTSAVSWACVWYEKIHFRIHDVEIKLTSGTITSDVQCDLRYSVLMDIGEDVVAIN